MKNNIYYRQKGEVWNLQKEWAHLTQLLIKLSAIIHMVINNIYCQYICMAAEEQLM